MFDAVEGAAGHAAAWIEKRAVAGTTARHLGRVSWPPAKFACSSDAVIVAVRGGSQCRSL